MYTYAPVKIHQCGRPGNVKIATVHLVQYLTLVARNSCLSKNTKN